MDIRVAVELGLGTAMVAEGVGTFVAVLGMVMAVGLDVGRATATMDARVEVIAIALGVRVAEDKRGAALEKNRLFPIRNVIPSARKAITNSVRLKNKNILTRDFFLRESWDSVSGWGK
ncbi:MAG: hypothetical protein HZB51_13240 [Chloroflexi bacterium]|nr:hypothetical protein [Chloroflexota bacterium]